MQPMLCKNNPKSFFKKVAPENVMVSMKLDGVRCLADADLETYTSRNGKPFKNFDIFTPYLQRLAEVLREEYKIDQAIFDGEVVAEGGDFSKVMTQVHRIKEVDPSQLRFQVFDIVLPGYEFYDRYKMLVLAEAKLDFGPVEIVPHIHIHIADEQTLLECTEVAVENGYEGLVLKDATSPYEHKKSVFWLKSKLTETADIAVIGVVPGTGKHEGRMGALLCDFNGVTVKVGTGFSDAEREEFMENPPALIEVSYQEITKAGSLRFPAFIRVRNDK